MVGVQACIDKVSISHAHPFFISFYVLHSQLLNPLLVIHLLLQTQLLIKTWAQCGRLLLHTMRPSPTMK